MRQSLHPPAPPPPCRTRSARRAGARDAASSGDATPPLLHRLQRRGRRKSKSSRESHWAKLGAKAPTTFSIDEANLAEDAKAPLQKLPVPKKWRARCSLAVTATRAAADEPAPGARRRRVATLGSASRKPSDDCEPGQRAAVLHRAKRACWQQNWRGHFIVREVAPQLQRRASRILRSSPSAIRTRGFLSIHQQNGNLSPMRVELDPQR